MVHQFHERGNTVEIVYKGGCKRVPLPEDVEHHIKNELEEVQFLSLHERVQLIKDRFQFEMSVYWLWLTYKRNGIVYAQ